MEITNDILYRALMRRTEHEHRELLKVCRANDRLNTRFQSLNDELDRIAEAPLRETRTHNEIEAMFDAVYDKGDKSGPIKTI